MWQPVMVEVGFLPYTEAWYTLGTTNHFFL